ncbi:hypothetical protein J3F84DRAFT_390349 [Trichoderma pleuroticola]
MEHNSITQGATASNDRFRSIGTTCRYLAAGWLFTSAFCVVSSQVTQQAVNAYSWKAYCDYIPAPLYSFIDGLDDFEVYCILSVAILYLCIICVSELLGETRCHPLYALPITVATFITLITFSLATGFGQGDTIKFTQAFLIILNAYLFIGHMVDIYINWRPRVVIKKD